MDAFTPEQRAVFEASAEALHVPRGEYLIRRGEPGGDLFLLRQGRLEAVDTRSSPEVILAVMKPGKVVGELSFLDGSPRSVDVRVAEHAEVLRWAHRDLRALLKREPQLAASFFESVAQLASVRMRRLTDSAMTGTLLSQDADAGASVERSTAEAERGAATVKAALLRTETLLREAPTDPASEGALREVLFDLQERLDALMAAWPGSLERSAIAEVLQRELHPYLVRSALADRSIRRPQGVTATPEILSHILVGRPSGEGRLGEIVDDWLLERPTLLALRELADRLPLATVEPLPKHRNRRILVLNAGTSSIVARISALTDSAPTLITVVDPSRNALALLDTDVAPVPPNVTIEAVQHDLAELAVHRLRHTFAPADVVVVHGLLEYLPDRLVVSLLRMCTMLCNPEGRVIAATLSDSADRHLLDRLLRWPSLRRPFESLVRLHHAAGLEDVTLHEATAPALLTSARAVAQAPASR